MHPLVVRTAPGLSFAAGYIIEGIGSLYSRRDGDPLSKRQYPKYVIAECIGYPRSLTGHSGYSELMRSVTCVGVCGSGRTGAGYHEWAKRTVSCLGGTFGIRFK